MQILQVEGSGVLFGLQWFQLLDAVTGVFVNLPLRGCPPLNALFPVGHLCQSVLSLLSCPVLFCSVLSVCLSDGVGSARGALYGPSPCESINQSINQSISSQRVEVERVFVLSLSLGGLETRVSNPKTCYSYDGNPHIQESPHPRNPKSPKSLKKAFLGLPGRSVKKVSKKSPNTDFVA